MEHTDAAQGLLSMDLLTSRERERERQFGRRYGEMPRGLEDRQMGMPTIRGTGVAESVRRLWREVLSALEMSLTFVIGALVLVGAAAAASSAAARLDVDLGQAGPPAGRTEALRPEPSWAHRRYTGARQPNIASGERTSR